MPPEAQSPVNPYLQVRDTLGALAERFAALRIDAGGLHLSRLARVHSRGLALKRIVMYSPNWVRSQNRMASTSNQARHSFPCTMSCYNRWALVEKSCIARYMLTRVY